MDPEANRNQEKINSINSSFLSALDDFKKYYIFYHKNPDVDEYSDNFLNSKGQLQTLSGNMFTITNNIQKNIEDMNTNISDISVKLTNERTKNQRLEKILANLKGTESGSNLLIDDSKTEYTLIFFKNFELLIGILFILGLLVSPKAALVLFIIAIILSYYLGILKIILPVIGHI